MPRNEAEVQGERIDSRKGDSQAGSTADAVARRSYGKLVAFVATGTRTMAANQSGLQLKTIRAIAMAWRLTLPVTMVLSGTLFSITARSSMKEISKRVIVQPRQDRVLLKLE